MGILLLGVSCFIHFLRVELEEVGDDFVSGSGVSGAFISFNMTSRNYDIISAVRARSFGRKTKDKNMAKPVKETPILFGEEARQFEVRMLHPKPLSPERIEAIRRDYEFLRKKCVNCTF